MKASALSSPPSQPLFEKPSMGTDRFGQLTLRSVEDEHEDHAPKQQPWYRRFIWLIVAIASVLLILLIVLLVTFVALPLNKMPVEAQWLDLTGFPPLPTGVATVIRPKTAKQVSGCVSPQSLWTCTVPTDQDASTQGQPNFRLEITFKNHTLPSNETMVAPSNTTTSKRDSGIVARAATLAGASAWTSMLFSPSPEPPSTKDQIFLGDTTDEVSEPYNGEETPFYISLLNASALLRPQGSRLRKRDDTFHYPFPTTSTLTSRASSLSASTLSASASHASASFSNPYPYPVSSTTGSIDSTATSSVSTSHASTDVAESIPPAATLDDGEPAAAELYQLASAQPLRLFNRGQDSEYYGFYTYFNRSLYIANLADSTSSTSNASSAENGTSNVPLDQASAVCTWSQTRLLVQIWTRRADVTSLSSTSSTHIPAWRSTANDMAAPGSFPYPITITLDRHGGDSSEKGVYCYELDAEKHVMESAKTWVTENRAFGGKLVNPSVVPENNRSDLNRRDEGTSGGIDGGTGGCTCQWQNWGW